MKLKDFAVGQKVYLVSSNGAKEDSVQECVVRSIGRKYLKTENADHGSFVIRYFVVSTKETDPFLIEHTEYGDKRLLFPAKEAVAEYFELLSLRDWLVDAADWPERNLYTLRQLRAVKEILDA